MFNDLHELNHQLRAFLTRETPRGSGLFSFGFALSPGQTPATSSIRRRQVRGRRVRIPGSGGRRTPTVAIWNAVTTTRYGLRDAFAAVPDRCCRVLGPHRAVKTATRRPRIPRRRVLSQRATSPKVSLYLTAVKPDRGIRASHASNRFAFRFNSQWRMSLRVGRRRIALFMFRFDNATGETQPMSERRARRPHRGSPRAWPTDRIFGRVDISADRGGAPTWRARSAPIFAVRARA